MIWQDYVIAVVQFAFALALVPTTLHASDKPPVLTSGPTAIGMFVIAATMATLGLWWSTATATAGGVLWTIIAVQRMWRTA